MKKNEILTEILKNQRLYDKANKLLDLLERAGEISYSLDCAGRKIEVQATIVDTSMDEHTGDLEVTNAIEKIRDEVYNVLSSLINQSKQLHDKYKVTKK